MKTLCGRIKHIVSLTQHQLHICFLDIFYSGFMDWGGLDLRDRGFWIRDILDIIVSGCMDLGRSGSSGQELLDLWRLSCAWLLHLKVQRVHYQLNSSIRFQISLQVIFLTNQRILTYCW